MQPLKLRLSQAKRVPLSAISDSSDATFFNCKADVVLVKSDNATYTACSSGTCYKKVVALNNGMFSCSKCQQEFYEYTPRFLLSMVLADYSDHHWVTCFNDVAEVILGHSATELNDWKDSDPEAYQRVFENANFTSYVFKLRAQMSMYNDEQRLKISVMSATSVDHVTYAKDLLKEMEELYGKTSAQ